MQNYESVWKGSFFEYDLIFAYTCRNGLGDPFPNLRWKMLVFFWGFFIDRFMHKNPYKRFEKFLKSSSLEYGSKPCSNWSDHRSLKLPTFFDTYMRRYDQIQKIFSWPLKKKITRITNHWPKLQCGFQVLRFECTHTWPLIILSEWNKKQLPDMNTIHMPPTFVVQKSIAPISIRVDSRSVSNVALKMRS